MLILAPNSNINKLKIGQSSLLFIFVDNNFICPVTLYFHFLLLQIEYLYSTEFICWTPNVQGHDIREQEGFGAWLGDHKSSTHEILVFSCPYERDPKELPYHFCVRRHSKVLGCL